MKEKKIFKYLFFITSIILYILLITTKPIFAYEAESESFKLNWSNFNQFTEYKGSPSSTTVSPDQQTSIFNLIEMAVFSNLGTTEGTALVLRYIIAALVVLLSLFISFFTFGKNVTKGIESVGRNPLAKDHIQFMVILNLVMIIILNISSIVIALAIIKL